MHPHIPQYLLDTSVFIDFLRTNHPIATDYIMRAAQGKINGFISTITLGEIWAGICRRNDKERHYLAVAPMQKIPISAALAMRGGELRCLAQVDLPDGIIAATAEHYHYTIVTSNTAHFERLKAHCAIQVETYNSQ